MRCKSFQLFKVIFRTLFMLDLCSSRFSMVAKDKIIFCTFLFYYLLCCFWILFHKLETFVEGMVWTRRILRLIICHMCIKPCPRHRHRLCFTAAHQWYDIQAPSKWLFCEVTVHIPRFVCWDWGIESLAKHTFFRAHSAAKKTRYLRWRYCCYTLWSCFGNRDSLTILGDKLGTLILPSTTGYVSGSALNPPLDFYQWICSSKLGETDLGIFHPNKKGGIFPTRNVFLIFSPL